MASLLCIIVFQNYSKKSQLKKTIPIEGSHSFTKRPDGGTVCGRGWSGLVAELAELALVNQVDQLTHPVGDVTTDHQLMTTPY